MLKLQTLLTGDEVVKMKADFSQARYLFDSEVKHLNLVDLQHLAPYLASKVNLTDGAAVANVVEVLCLRAAEKNLSIF